MNFINLLEIKNTTKIHSPENKYLNTYSQIQKLVSNDIETKNVSVIKRPLVDLKKVFKKITESPICNDKPIDFESKIPTDEVCGAAKI